MNATPEQPEAESGAVPVRLGDTVRDTRNEKVGRVMGFEGPYVQLRPGVGRAARTAAAGLGG